MRVHRLKTWPQHHADAQRGEMTFELRRNDRDFQVGDLLELVCWEPQGAEEVEGCPVVVRAVAYMTDFPQALRPGFVCMALREATMDELMEGLEAITAGRMTP